MSKFDQMYKSIAEGMKVIPAPISNTNKPLTGGMPADLAAAGYERMPSNIAMNQMSPEQQAEFSKALTDILNKAVPNTVSTPGFKPANNSSANLGTAVASVIPKIKAAGVKALDTVGNLTVKEILGVAKNVLTAPVQVQQAALRNLTQAGIKTGQDVANILMGIAKQKGASDQEIQKILNDIEQEQRINQYMKG